MDFSKYTFASGTNISFIEELYKTYRENPESVDVSWQKFFEGYEFALSAGPMGDVWSGEGSRESANVEAFINAYRRLGHLSAHLNPLEPKPEIPSHMSPQAHGLDKIDPNRKFIPSNFGETEMTFAEIFAKLKATYCGTIGADFRESNDIEAVTWLQEIMESCQNKPNLAPQNKRRILEKLCQAENFEHFLHSRYLGQKRFSAEGLDTLIPLLDTLIDEAALTGTEEINFGMAHRGRLNVLAHVLEKPYERILIEFEGAAFNPFDIEGDVKYHLGCASEVSTFSNKKIRLYLSPNPSHLEAIDANVEGFTRSRQEKFGGIDAVIPVLLHGDASMIGQGVVAEVLNLSQLKDYSTGGTIHIITNNQIGFTTNPEDGRSCAYSSDISKVIRAPVLHVNADDPEAVVWVVKIAVMYRKKFHKDIVIDLVGYRRHGHNETDEPGFTQPLMYKKIEAQKSVLSLYSAALLQEGVVSKDEIEAWVKKIKDSLQEAQKFVRAKDVVFQPIEVPPSYKAIFDYRKPERKEVMTPVSTQISAERLANLAKEITRTPEGFTPNPKIARLLENRSKMLDGKGAVDWAFAELLAFASLASENFGVRLSGQDCKRGTFSSRHAVVFDYETGKPCELMRRAGWAPVQVINSPLSELGCMGFEFGYSVSTPNTLVLWEAQFGDFANGAQILIDQFLVASEAKWQQTSGLVLLLPHGHEGMGPEHTSARPERFLQCCGNLNIQVCNVSTPAQLFHLLRRQMLRKFRKPLVLMTPKSLLRHPKFVSETKEFTGMTFQEVLEDSGVPKNDSTERLIMCTGKIYYELVAMREAQSEFASMPILRLEQMYPFPYEMLAKALQRYPRVSEVVWVQEEPQNMGAWNFVRSRIPRAYGEIKKVSYVGRKNSGSTAEGSSKAHALEQKRITEDAFAVPGSKAQPPAKNAKKS